MGGGRDGGGGGGWEEGGRGREEGGQMSILRPAVLSVLNLGTLYTCIPNNTDSVEPLCYIVFLNLGQL